MVCRKILMFSALEDKMAAQCYPSGDRTGPRQISCGRGTAGRVELCQPQPMVFKPSVRVTTEHFGMGSEFYQVIGYNDGGETGQS